LLGWMTWSDLFSKHKGHPSGQNGSKDKPVGEVNGVGHDAAAFCAIIARALGVAVT